MKVIYALATTMRAAAVLLYYFRSGYFNAGFIHSTGLFLRLQFSLYSVHYTAITNNSTNVTGTSQIPLETSETIPGSRPLRLTGTILDEKEHRQRQGRQNRPEEKRVTLVDIRQAVAQGRG
jgi:hypothetical protein